MRVMDMYSYIYFDFFFFVLIADACFLRSELQSLFEILFSRAVCLRWVTFYKMVLTTTMMVIMLMLTMVKMKGDNVGGE